MTEIPTPHVGDVGTIVRYQFLKASDGSALDISSSTQFKMLFTKPNRETVLYTEATTPAVVLAAGGGVDGKIQVTTPGSPASLWDLPGLWKLEPWVKTGTNEYEGEHVVFRVRD